MVTSGCLKRPCVFTRGGRSVAIRGVLQEALVGTIQNSGERKSAEIT
jgi:hypothetical protein